MRSKSTNNNIASNEKTYYRHVNNATNEKTQLYNQVQASQFVMNQQETSNLNEFQSIMKMQATQHFDKEV